MFTRFKAISFDCYGTLIDWESGILGELAPWARGRGLRAAPDELLEAFGALELAAEADAPRLPYPEILARVHAGLAERFGTPPDPAAARSFGSSVGRWPAFADSAEALLHAAQSKTHDIVPARRLGLPAVWIDRRRGRTGWGATAPPSGDSKPDLSFESMAAFAEATSSC